MSESLQLGINRTAMELLNVTTRWFDEDVDGVEDESDDDVGAMLPWRRNGGILFLVLCW